MALSLTVHRTLPVRQDMQRSANLHRPRERQQWAHLKPLGFVRKRLGFDTVFHVLEAWTALVSWAKVKRKATKDENEAD